MEIGVVEGPDAEWRDRIVPFLGHKSVDTREHIRRALEEPLDDLRTLFYVGCVQGRVITGLMIVGARGVGILGHVYTLPEERRKGAYSLLMRAQMADVERTGFRLLCLGTGFERPPYWIYYSFGFRSIGPGRGEMIWRREPAVEETLFAPGPSTVRGLRWDDWSWMDVLGMQPVAPDEPLPRAAAFGLKTQGSLEGAFVPFVLQRERDPRIQAFVLESHTGATAGFSLVAPDRRWFGDVWVADVYVHPNFRGEEVRLLASLEWPECRCAAYRVASDGAANPWQAAGFRLQALLPGWLAVEGESQDLEVWARSC